MKKVYCDKLSTGCNQTIIVNGIITSINYIAIFRKYHIKGFVTYDFFQLYLPAPQRYNARP
jgi:hypothetical protein